jgi:hypothetical protein
VTLTPPPPPHPTHPIFQKDFLSIERELFRTYCTLEFCKGINAEKQKRYQFI